MLGLSARTTVPAVPQFYLPVSSDPGEWSRTPSCPPLGGAFLHWRNVTPFGVPPVDRFMPPPPPPLTSGIYRRDYDEVKRVAA